MTYAYLEKLNRSSLLERTSATLSFYGEIDKNTKRMGNDPYMSTAERIQFYQQLKELSKKGELPEKYNKTIQTMERAFSQIEVTVPSATKEGELTYLHDTNGNRVSLMQLLDNPNATYKWECEGSLIPNNYVTQETVTRYTDRGTPYDDDKNTPKNGVSLDTSSSCSGKTQTFEASGSTILGDIKTGNGYSALLMLDYSHNLFR